MSVVIRPATADDSAAISALLAELGYPAPADAIPVRLERMQAEGQHVLLAGMDGRVVGLASLFLRHVISADAPFARLAALVVRGDQRGEGVGSALVAEVEGIARRAGCSEIEVTSGLHRPAAHEFYLARGFTEKPRRFVKPLR